MPKKCIVKDCRSRYKSNNDHASMFQLPGDNKLRVEWIRAIPTKLDLCGNKENVASTTKHYVCEKHFLPFDIKRSCKYVITHSNRLQFLNYRKSKYVEQFQILNKFFVQFPCIQRVIIDSTATVSATYAEMPSRCRIRIRRKPARN